MFSSPILYAWVAWLLVVCVIAVLRFVAHQHEERQRAERRQRRSGQAAGSVPDKALIVSRPRTTKRPIPADYREQLVAAGIIQPASDLATPEPVTQV